MKFYEHIAKKHAPYYVLIAADSAAEAQGIYESDTDTLDGDSLREISEQEARAKFDEDGTAIGDLDRGFDNAVRRSPAVLLISRVYL